jgi:UDP-N-acetylglucosamine:LPS N-acetylglucosamine transferase
MKKILMVASAGGHWVELNLLNSAVKKGDVIYMTTNRELAEQNKEHQFFAVPDASRWDRMRIVLLACKMLWIIIWIRPDVVISTGALPGFFAIFFGKKFGAKTIWVDSIAKSETLSMSGQKAGKYADLWLTQWEHLACLEGPQYYGAVI